MKQKQANTTANVREPDTKATKRYTTVVFSLTALTVLFAWVHSCFPAHVSAQESGSILELMHRFFGFFGIGETLTDHIVRKLAHVTEYTVIGVLLLLCGYCFDRSKPIRFAIPILFTGLMTAVIDETIQIFSEGRAGLLSDVWLDFGSIIFGALVMLGITSLHWRRLTRKSSVR